MPQESELWSAAKCKKISKIKQRWWLIFSVEKVIDMVTSNSDVDENKEFEELDTFETKIR